MGRHLRPPPRRCPPAPTSRRCSRACPATCASARTGATCVEGSITVRYADGTEEMNRAGELYYWPGGHTGWTDEGVTFIEFSPAARDRSRCSSTSARSSAPDDRCPGRAGSVGALPSTAVAATQPDADASDPLARARASLARLDWQAALDASLGRCPVDGAPAPALEADRLDLLAEAGVVARPARRLHRRPGRRRTARYEERRRPAARPGQCAVWLYEHHAFKAPAGDRRRRGCAGPAAPSTAATRRPRRTARCCSARPRAAHGRGRAGERPASWRTQVVDAGPAAALGRPRGRGAADRRAASSSTRASRPTGMAPPRRGDALRGRGPAAAVLDRQGVLQPDQRLRGRSATSAAPPSGPRRPARWARGPPVRDLPRASAGCTAPSCCKRARRRGTRPSEQARRPATELVGSSTCPTPPPAYAEVGDIRRRLGDLDGAEEAFARRRGAERPACRPGSRSLRLAQGHVDAAMAIINRAAWTTPAWNRLARARLLPAMVQVAIAAGDLDRRRGRRSPSCSPSPRTSPAPSLQAAGARPRGPGASWRRATGGACATLRGRVRAVAGARRALRGGHRPHAPGQACRKAGDDDGAAASFEAARRPVRPDRRPARPAPPARRHVAERLRAAGRAHRARGRGAAPGRRRA